MHRRRTAESRRGRLLSVESIAGWVFADLLLVLFVVGLASAIPQEPPAPEPAPVPQANQKKPKPRIVGMKTAPAVRTVTFDAAALVSPGTPGRAEGQAVCRDIRRARGDLTGSKAALVLIFGGAPSASPGQQVAREVGSQLTCADKALFPEGTPYRAFWDGSLGYGTARLEIFVFTTKKSASAGAN